MKPLARLFVLTCLFVIAFPTATNAIDEIEREIDNIRAKVHSGEVNNKVLEAAKSVQAKAETLLDQLKAENAKLESEKNDLQRVQSILASGVIGALATAAVAVLAALSNRGRSKAERDLKRLEVLEKSRSLQKSGIDIPADIIRHYHASPTQASGTAEEQP